MDDEWDTGNALPWAQLGRSDWLLCGPRRILPLDCNGTVLPFGVVSNGGRPGSRGHMLAIEEAAAAVS